MSPPLKVYVEQQGMRFRAHMPLSLSASPRVLCTAAALKENTKSPNAC